MYLHHPRTGILFGEDDGNLELVRAALALRYPHLDLSAFEEIDISPELYNNTYKISHVAQSVETDCPLTPSGKIMLNAAMAAPKRHYHIHHGGGGTGGLYVLDIKDSALYEQGFLTSDGVFINRSEGLILAKRLNQLINPEPHCSDLFSEDLW